MDRQAAVNSIRKTEAYGPICKQEKFLIDGVTTRQAPNRMKRKAPLRKGKKQIEVASDRNTNPGAPLESRPPGFWQTLKILLSNKRFFICLILITIPVGIGAQLSWLQFRCIGEPFFGSVKATCRDNLARMIFGGPAVTVAALILATWAKRQKNQISESTLLIPFYFLLPTLALPFIGNEQRHDRIIFSIEICFVITFCIIARHKLADILSGLFAKPAFSLDCRVKNGSLLITAKGEMSHQERRWILERTLSVIGSHGANFDRVTIDFRALQKAPEEFSEIIQILLAYARYAGKSVETIGDAHFFKK